MKGIWRLSIAAAAVAAMAITAVQASSHREAPLISAGPARRQHRRLRVRQPECAGQGDADRELHSVRGAVRRPELLQVRRQRALRNHGRQRRRRRRGRHVPVQVPHRRPQPEYVSLQHRPDYLARLHDLNVRQFYTRDARRRSAAPRSRHSARGRTCRRRRSMSASARRRITRRSPRRGASSAERRRKSSPASATIRSSSTSACFDLLAVPPADPRTSTGSAGFNVHTIAIQVPISTLTANGARPSTASDPNAVIGVWSTDEPALGHESRRRPGARTAETTCRCRASATRWSTRWSSRAA